MTKEDLERDFKKRHEVLGANERLDIKPSTVAFQDLYLSGIKLCCCK